MAGTTERVLEHLLREPASLSDLARHCQSRVAARQIIYRLRQKGYDISLRPSGSAKVEPRYYLNHLPNDMRPYFYPEPNTAIAS